MAQFVEGAKVGGAKLSEPSGYMKLLMQVEGSTGGFGGNRGHQRYASWLLVMVL